MAVVQYIKGTDVVLQIYMEGISSAVKYIHDSLKCFIDISFTELTIYFIGLEKNKYFSENIILANGGGSGWDSCPTER